MSWDIAQNLQTGDWEFDSKRDLKSADGLGLIQQRIHRRLIVQRDEYLYDRSGTFGSRLRTLLNMGVPAASAGLEMLIREALAPMDDITITNISVYSFNDGSNVVQTPTEVLARISYQLNFSTISLPPESLGQLSTDVSIPI